jgi:hypothetical protein
MSEGLTDGGAWSPDQVSCQGLTVTNINTSARSSTVPDVKPNTPLLYKEIAFKHTAEKRLNSLLQVTLTVTFVDGYKSA